MRIINIPIEPLVERYSIDWHRWFISQFKEQNIKYIDIYPRSEKDKIEQGQFLDVINTNRYKTKQLSLIYWLLSSREIGLAGDVFFFHDLWFPGIEGLAYIRDGLKLKFKICGCLHAGTYDPHDYLSQQGMSYWGKFMEQGWFRLVDKIFVATKYHKALIQRHRKGIPKNKISVTGFPIFPQTQKANPKNNIIVFPHRLADEKQPNIFDSLKLKHKQEWSWVKTKEVCKTKEEYYALLAKAKISVSFALQETWGIAMQESVFAGCIPIVPNRLSYPEMYPIEFIYKKNSDIVPLIRAVIESNKTHTKKLKRLAHRFAQAGKEAIPNMVKEMEALCQK